MDTVDVRGQLGRTQGRHRANAPGRAGGDAADEHPRVRAGLNWSARHGEIEQTVLIGLLAHRIRVCTPRGEGAHHEIDLHAKPLLVGHLGFVQLVEELAKPRI